MGSVPRRSVASGGMNLNVGNPPSQRFSPFKELGTSGVAIFGGRPVVRETNSLVVGTRKWQTYADLLSNVSIVAAGIRYFLNIVAHANWTVVPPNDSSEAKGVAEFVDSVINSMETPWRRVARRSAMYRFNGFSIQEWTAVRRPDGKIGFDDIESRPAHTIDRWEVDEKGTVVGTWQLSPQTSQWIYLPRPKILYLVEDSVSDSPEGMGVFRHMIDPYIRLQKYLTLEGRGFERDLRGIPIGRAPYRAIANWVAAGTMSKEDAARITRAIEDFVQIQCKAEDTSIVLDSAPYVVETDSGKAISGVMQYGLDLLTGASPDFANLAGAVDRLNMEMARIIGVEHLLLGGGGGANRALSEDKSRNFYLSVNGSLNEIADGINKDIIVTICDLNGIKEELRPKIDHSDVSFRSVGEITAALAQMATAGAVLAPDDEAINDVRDMLGVAKAAPPSPMGMLQALGGKPEEGKPDGNPQQREGQDVGVTGIPDVSTPKGKSLEE